MDRKKEKTNLNKNQKEHIRLIQRTNRQLSSMILQFEGSNTVCSKFIVYCWLMGMYVQHKISVFFN